MRLWMRISPCWSTYFHWMLYVCSSVHCQERECDKSSIDKTSPLYPCTWCSSTHCGLNDMDILIIRFSRDTWMHDVCHCVMVSLMVVLKGMTFVMLRVFSKMVDSAAITFSTQSCVFSWDVWYCFSHFVVLVIVQWRDNDYKLTHECKGVWCFLFMRIRCKELCSVDHAALASCMM